MRPYVLLLVAMFLSRMAGAQSLEMMVGHQGIFADVQWLEPLDEAFRWSVFSRTRATVDYDNRTSLFTGAYLNHTTRSGIGVSIVGKVGDTGGGADAGLHIFKPRKNWMLFGLASVGIKQELEYSWFSIFRFSPPISEKWKLFTGLELFTLFNRQGHAFSVQRIRLGLDFKGYQFGLAANLSQAGKEPVLDQNLGGFIRRSF